MIHYNLLIAVLVLSIGALVFALVLSRPNRAYRIGYQRATAQNAQDELELHEALASEFSLGELANFIDGYNDAVSRNRKEKNQ